jgi:outer membrane lipoprotein SlyB
MTLLNKAGAFASNPNNWIYTILLIFIVGFAGGAFGQSGNVYSDRSAQQSAQVLRGQILQAREVFVQPSDSARYPGGTAGAALGGGADAWIGRNSRGAQAVLGIAGAALGGVAGSNAAQNLAANRAIEYIVEAEGDRFHPGARMMSIVQPEPGPFLGAGEMVYLIQNGATWRVVRIMDPGTSAAMAPARDDARSARPSLQDAAMPSIDRY